MNFIVDTLNAWSQAWAGPVLTIVWQSTLLAGIVGGISFWLRRASPGLRYWLWQIVAIKLLLMPFWVVWVPLPFFVNIAETDSPATVALASRVILPSGDQLLPTRVGSAETTAAEVSLEPTSQ